MNSSELVEFKNRIAQYFAERAIDGANKAWDSNDWTEKDVDDMLNTKMRKSKK